MTDATQGNLSNPAIFLDTADPRTNPSQFQLAHRYLDIVSNLKTRTAGSAIKAHLFRLLKPTVEKNPSYRERLGMMIGEDLDKWRGIVNELQTLYEVSLESTYPWHFAHVNRRT